MAQLDPTKIHVDSKVVPIWEQESASFQDIMAEQIRHAPWLMLSVVIHGVVLTLLWVMMPAEDRSKLKNVVEVQLPDAKEIVEPPPPPPPEPKKEETKDEPILQDSEVTEPTEPFDPNVTDSPMKEAAFDSNQWNAAVGLGGGAGGKYGGRGGGRGGGGVGKSTAAAIESGLEWLRNHQDEDGKWDCDGFMKHDK